ncbi:MAG: hypothetical protein SWY16_09065 [Cyanobacteriota bacterium]|nr:hypothetical protein [Cyanobacteriota bacterium]
MAESDVCVVEDLRLKMKLFSLPPEDRPPETTSKLDIRLRQQLERATSKHFFEACNGPAQGLLVECAWTIAIVEVLTLAIHCPDRDKNWRVLNNMTSLAKYLAKFSTQAKIQVHPPSGEGEPFEMRVDERLEYRDRL